MDFMLQYISSNQKAVIVTEQCYLQFICSLSLHTDRDKKGKIDENRKEKKKFSIQHCSIQPIFVRGLGYLQPIFVRRHAAQNKMQDNIL